MLKKMFSICMPIYNVSKYLERCLESIYKQEFTDYEVIMIDDGSTDTSSKICKKYCQKSERFKYFYYKNSGVSVTRNRLLDKATGRYIIMVDPDDYIEQGMFNAIYEKINYFENIDLIRFKSKVINDKIGKDVYRFNYEHDIDVPIDGILALNLWSSEQKKYAVPWLYCIKKELYEKTKFPTGRVHEDFAIYPIILARAQNVITLDKVCYYYVQNSNSLMNDKNIDKEIKKLEDWLVNYSNLIKTLEKIFNEKNVQYEIKNTILNDIRDRTILRIKNF